MPKEKKIYSSPKITKYSSVSDLPTNLRAGLEDILDITFSVAFDEQRVYRHVPPEFARFLGYQSEELTGRRLDDITVQGTVDIDFVFNAFLQLGEMDGLWLFRDREGRSRLFRYHARRRDDQLTADFQPLPLAG